MTFFISPQAEEEKKPATEAEVEADEMADYIDEGEEDVEEGQVFSSGKDGGCPPSSSTTPNPKAATGTDSKCGGSTKKPPRSTPKSWRSSRRPESMHGIGPTFPF